MRAGRYSPAAWWRFLVRSFRRSVDDAQGEPALLRSALRQSALLESMALAAVYWHNRRQHAQHWIKRALRVSIVLFVQQGFVVLHLGMVQETHAAARFKGLGAATFLTSLRGLCAMLLAVDAADLPLMAVLGATGSATDALDGAIARRCGTQSRIGEMLDPAMDVAFYTAMVNAAISRGALPCWFGWVVVARFLLPSGAGLYRYFGLTQTLEAAHTAWGKSASALLAAVVALSLIRPRGARLLCFPTAALLIVAGGLQGRRALQAARPYDWVRL